MFPAPCPALDQEHPLPRRAIPPGNPADRRKTRIDKLFGDHAGNCTRTDQSSVLTACPWGNSSADLMRRGHVSEIWVLETWMNKKLYPGHLELSPETQTPSLGAQDPEDRTDET